MNLTVSKANQIDYMHIYILLCRQTLRSFWICVIYKKNCCSCLWISNAAEVALIHGRRHRNVYIIKVHCQKDGFHPKRKRGKQPLLMGNEIAVLTSTPPVIVGELEIFVFVSEALKPEALIGPKTGAAVPRMSSPSCSISFHKHSIRVFMEIVSSPFFWLIGSQFTWSHNSIIVVGSLTQIYCLWIYEHISRDAY